MWGLFTRRAGGGEYMSEKRCEICGKKDWLQFMYHQHDKIVCVDCYEYPEGIEDRETKKEEKEK